jgi:predicted component of type VI protein secretion system
MNSTKLTIFVFLVLCLSGCASYKANKIPTVDYPKNQNRKLTVFIKGSDTKLNNGKIGGNIESEFIKKIETTGLYSVVKIADKSNI